MQKPVVLVNPGNRRFVHSIHPPLNLGYLASYLIHHEVPTTIIDEPAGDDVKKRLREIKPEFVGITAMTPNSPAAYEIARAAKSLGATTIMGGVHASIMTEEALSHVDIVVKGEGERALLDIVQGRTTSRVVEGEAIGNIDDIPSPKWDLFHMDHYASSRDRFTRTHLHFVPPRTRIAAVITTRGCPYACIFCYNSWRKYAVRFHSPERVVTEIEELVHRFGIQAIFFFDDDFFVNKNRLMRICALLKERVPALSWGCQANANSITLDSMRAVKDAGCRQIGFGFESGSQRILEMLKGRQASVEKNRNALRMCSEVGIASWATFMVGNPTETLEDLQATASFVRNNHIDGIGVHICTPFPGTDLWNWSKEHGLLDHIGDWGTFTTGGGIYACDTLPSDTIRKYRDLIEYANRPVSAREILAHISDRPHLLLDAFRRPAKTLRMLGSLVSRSPR